MSLNSSSVIVRLAMNILSLRSTMTFTRMTLSSVKIAGYLYSGIFLVILVTFVVSCATKPVSYEQGTTVAIWDLEDLSPMESGHADLGQLLSAKVIETLKETGRHTIVERERLLLALEELSLGTTSLVDETTRLRIGRIVGARLMVFGAYQVIADKMRIDLRLVEVETGSILKAAQKTTSAADLSEWLKAAQEATMELF